MERKTIYCPVCKRKAIEYDGRSTMIMVKDCKNCNRRVVYNPVEDKVTTKSIPPRNCMSGKTFY